MFPTQSTYGFASGYQKSYTLDENLLCSYAQGYLGVHPSMLGCWYAPSHGSEVSPWAWQWSEGMRIQEGLFAHNSYAANIMQPQVQPTCAVDRAPPAFSRVVGGPVLNTSYWPEIACPRPIYPLPKWIDTAGWEDDEEKTMPEQDGERSDLTQGPVDNDNDTDTNWKGEKWSGEEDYGEGLDTPHQFLPSFILSPDPEDLPAPFFHPSSDPTPSPHTFASLSPDACELPQPRFDSDPYSPISNVSSPSNLPGLDSSWSSRTESFESVVSPDPGDLPPPDFEVYDQLEAGGFEFPEHLDRHQDRLGERGARDHAGLALGERLWKVVIGGGRKVSGSGHPRKWLDWTRSHGQASLEGWSGRFEAQKRRWRHDVA